MTTMQLRFLAAGLFAMVIFASGTRLSRRRRPLNTAISSFHKLISLAAGIFVLTIVFEAQRMAPLGALEWAVVAITGLLFAGDAATGAMLTREGEQPETLRRLHRILPLLTGLSSGVCLYLLTFRP